jgi:phosphatidylglycerol:prolipoprotein diacylglycerol transferase
MFPDAPAYVYPAIVALAAAVGFAVVLYTGRAAGIPAGRLVILQLTLAALGHLGGRLYLLIELRAPWEWSDLLAVGYRHPGSIAGVLIGLLVLPPLLLPGISVALLADCVAPAIAFATVVMRIGCFVIGCCAGTVSTVPWAIQFPPESRVSRLHARLGLIPSSDLPSLHVHPLQVYFLALALAVGVVLVWLRPRKRYDGQVFLVFLALHETGKAALETLRENVPELATGSGVLIASLAAGVLAAAALVIIPLWRAREAGAASAVVRLH